MKTLRTLFIAALALTACRSETPLVLPQPPVISKFAATPTTVASGAMTTLEWATVDATDIEILNVGHGAVAGVDNKASGTVSVAVTSPSLFVLNASNARGVKTTALVSVAVEGAGQQVLFAALPALVAAGQSSTLVWSSPGARSVTLTPMGGTAIDLKGQLDTGSVTVSPTTTTTYSLVADGTTKTVEVGLAQSVVSFTASKNLSKPTEMVTLTWKTANAAKVTVSLPGQGALATETDAAKVADGSVMTAVPPFAAGTTVTYLLTVEGKGEPITAEARIVIGNQPVINTFTGPEYAKADAGFALSWTTANADRIELSTGGTPFYRSLTTAEAAAGSLTLPTPAAETDYTLAAISSASGASVTKTWKQKVVGAATVTTFTALPATIPNGGDAVTLTWSVPNARHVRITDSEGHTVASARGPAAETGTGTAYPNGATTYTLTADNTIDAPITATQMVAVTTPAAFGANGVQLAGNPTSVSWTIGGGTAQGIAGTQPSLQAASTGFIDISDGGTKLSFSSTDDATLSFTPPDFETFVFDTRVVPPFTASTNGFLVLGPAAATRATNVAIPATTLETNLLAPWWADLNLGTAGGVYWAVLNEGPERTLVVQWNHVTAKAAAGSDLTFEVKVHQTGVVTYEYKALTMLGMASPVIGAQGPPGVGVAGPPPASNSSLTFFGPTPSPVLVTLAGPTPVTGFIKLPNGYLRAKYTPQVVTAGQVGISEVLYSPAPAIAQTGEWVEVTNRSQYPLNLAGWTVDFGAAGSFIVDAGVPLAPGASVVLSQTERDAGNDDVATQFIYGGFSLSDDAGTVAIANGLYRTQTPYNSALPNNGGVGVSLNFDTQGHLVIGDATGTTPHGIACGSTTTFGSQLPLQLGSPGVTRQCLFSMQQIPVSYFDISDAGTPLFSSSSGWDDSLATVSLASAPVTYLGTTVTTMGVSTNGWVKLGAYTGSSNLTNKTVPSTTAPAGSVLAILWDDLDQNLNIPGNNVFSRRIAAGVDPANPAPHWIVQWHHWAHNASQSDDYNFQIKIFDSGIIEYHYAAMVSVTSSQLGNGNGATVWIESTDGGTALVQSINQPLVRPNTAFRFTP